MLTNSGKKYKIAFLVIDYVPHQTNSIKSFIEKENAEILAFHAGLFEKKIPNFSNFSTSLYSNYSKKQIAEKIMNFKPDILVVAGWMIKEYVWVAQFVKKNMNIPVVALSDTQWNNTIKQKVNSIISPIYLKKAFSHLWVAGIYQYEYARKLGFEKSKILFNSLSADVDFFSNIDLSLKNISFPKRLLFIGRFAPEKGLDILLDAWSEIENKKGWILTLVGKGDYNHSYLNDSSVQKMDYMNSVELRNMMQESGAFILPSNYEPWALVIHEAASAGLPIIATNVCGAVPHFVINNYNGFITTTDQLSIQNAIVKFLSLNTSEIIQMSIRSQKLAKEITMEKHIKSLMQIV